MGAPVREVSVGMRQANQKSSSGVSGKRAGADDQLRVRQLPPGAAARTNLLKPRRLLGNGVRVKPTPGLVSRWVRGGAREEAVVVGG